VRNLSRAIIAGVLTLLGMFFSSVAAIAAGQKQAETVVVAIALALICGAIAIGINSVNRHPLDKS